MTSPTRDPDPNGWTSPLDLLLAQGAALPSLGLGAEVDKANPTIGTPGADTGIWEGKQQLPDDCAIKCQQFVLMQFTGHAIAGKADLAAGSTQRRGTFELSKGKR